MYEVYNFWNKRFEKFYNLLLLFTFKEMKPNLYTFNEFVQFKNSKMYTIENKVRKESNNTPTEQLPV